jgi:predicted AAA+ superfamily ATPase
MIIIQAMNDRATALPRALLTPLQLAARTMPVVVVTGARQTGKSTLVRELASDDRLYLTLDDIDVLDQANHAPEDSSPRGAHDLDEVQRAPKLLLAVKRAVDRGKRPKGRYFLTGSANLLLMRKVSESLAGRASYLTLWPLTRREQLGLQLDRGHLGSAPERQGRTVA